MPMPTRIVMTPPHGQHGLTMQLAEQVKQYRAASLNLHYRAAPLNLHALELAIKCIHEKNTTFKILEDNHVKKPTTKEELPQPTEESHVTSCATPQSPLRWACQATTQVYAQ